MQRKSLPRVFLLERDMLLLNIYPVQLNYSPLHQETGFHIKSSYEYGLKKTS